MFEVSEWRFAHSTTSDLRDMCGDEERDTTCLQFVSGILAYSVTLDLSDMCVTMMSLTLHA